MSDADRKKWGLVADDRRLENTVQWYEWTEFFGSESRFNSYFGYFMAWFIYTFF